MMKSALIPLLLSFSMAAPPLTQAMDVLVRPGTPVPFTPVRDQRSIGFCWAYATTGWIEGEILKQGGRIALSPEYNGFYNLYFQLHHHIPFYKVVAGRVTGLRSAPESTMRSKCVVVEHRDPIECLAHRLFEEQDFFEPGQGNDGPGTLANFAQVGVVPDAVFSHHFTPPEAQRLHVALAEFIAKRMLDPVALSQYEPVGPDGLNHALVRDLGRVFGAQPPFPDEEFEYAGARWTAKRLLARTGFSPDAFQLVPARNPREQELALNMIRSILQAGHAVPIGMPIFGDGSPDIEAQKKRLRETGRFSTDFCPGHHCPESLGGHAMLVVNWLEDPGQHVQGLITKNSWGLTGLNPLGEPDADPAHRGFYVVESNYLANGVAAGAPWTAIIPKLKR